MQQLVASNSDVCPVVYVIVWDSLRDCVKIRNEGLLAVSLNGLNLKGVVRVRPLLQLCEINKGGPAGTSFASKILLSSDDVLRLGGFQGAALMHAMVF